MIERYTLAPFDAIWSDQSRFEAYLKVELAVLEALKDEGVIPLEDFLKIKAKASFSLDRIKEIEKETKHDVIAFTRCVSESLSDERKWVHYGLTSTDVVDSAYALMYQAANKVILEDIMTILNSVKNKALEYKDTPCMGRTHGVHAEITSFGLKWALYYDELNRDLERFKHATKNIEVIKISGAVGTFSNLSPKIQDATAKILNLGSSHISTQVLQRDRHIEYFSSLAILATTLEKIALEIRHLQRTEVHEASEYFSKNQKGSSAMPHKKNPIGSENVMGLSRVIKSYVFAALDDNALWHERDISHSSVERVIAPDATSLMHYILKRMTNIIDNLIVYPDQMMKNIYLTKGIIFSGRFVNKLVDKGLNREEAYDLIQPLTFKAYEEGIMFKDLLLENERLKSLLTKEEIDACFDYRYHLRYVDEIYKRVGLC